MECERMRESLESYAAGRLEPAQASRLEAHLQLCPACAKELRWVRSLKAVVRGNPRPAMPAELRTELLRQAALCGSGERLPEKDGAPWRAARYFSWRWAAGLGFASAFAAAAVLVFGRPSTGTEDLTLDEVLEAHSRYQLTMPAADRESIFTGLGLRLSQQEARHG
jgi:anti-sigma factor RsiW